MLEPFVPRPPDGPGFKGLLPVIRPLAFLTVLGMASPAWAEMRTCETVLNGEPLALTFDDDDDVWASLRDGWFNRGTTCPGLVVLRHLTPDLTDKERGVFCAVWDEAGGQYTGFSQARQDAYGRCRKPGLICRGVTATAGEVASITGIGTRVQEGAETQEPPTLLGALAGQAGAVIGSGTAGYVASALQTAGTALAATVGGPAALAGAAVSVVAVGGAVYLCGG